MTKQKSPEKKNDGHCGWQKLSEKKFDAQHRSADIYSDIAKTLQQEGFEGRDWKQWRTKSKHLKQGEFLDCECSPSGKIWFDHEQVDGRGMAPLRQFVF